MNNNRAILIRKLNALIGYTIGVIILFNFFNRFREHNYRIILLIVVIGSIVHVSELLGVSLSSRYKNKDVRMIWVQLIFTIALLFLLFTVF